MLAKRRGETPIVSALVKAGATSETPDRTKSLMPPARDLPARLDDSNVRAAVSQAVPLLQKTSIKSKESFINHASHQDCTSCHQQFLPLAAIGMAKKFRVAVDKESELELIKMVQAGELKNPEVDWQPLFHPDAVSTKGYALFGDALEDVPANEYTDSAVHHLAAIQSKDGRWQNNLPRPPLQSSDVGATALAIHALQRYPLPGRKAELAGQVERARRWLWTVKADHQEARVYQLLGLAWAGESHAKLQPLAKALLAEQHPDGGWSQLPGTASDAYATGQATYALRIAAGFENAHPAVDHARRFLVETQLADGSWYVRRRAFPFQPTMNRRLPPRQGLLDLRRRDKLGRPGLEPAGLNRNRCLPAIAAQGGAGPKGAPLLLPLRSTHQSTFFPRVEHALPAKAGEGRIGRCCPAAPVFGRYGPSNRANKLRHSLPGPVLQLRLGKDNSPRRDRIFPAIEIENRGPRV